MSGYCVSPRVLHSDIDILCLEHHSILVFYVDIDILCPETRYPYVHLDIDVLSIIPSQFFPSVSIWILRSYPQLLSLQYVIYWILTSDTQLS